MRVWFRFLRLTRTAMKPGKQDVAPTEGIWIGALNTAYQRLDHPPVGAYVDVTSPDYISYHLQRAFLLRGTPLVLTPDQALDHFGIHKLIESLDGAQRDGFMKFVNASGLKVRSRYEELSANLEENIAQRADWNMFARSTVKGLADDLDAEAAKMFVDAHLNEMLSKDRKPRVPWSMRHHIDRLQQLGVSTEVQPDTEKVPLGDILLKYRTKIVDKFYDGDHVRADEILKRARGKDGFGVVHDLIKDLDSAFQALPARRGIPFARHCLMRANEERRARQAGADLVDVIPLPATVGKPRDGIVADPGRNDHLQILLARLEAFAVEFGPVHGRQFLFDWDLLAQLGQPDVRVRWEQELKRFVDSGSADVANASRKLAEILLDLIGSEAMKSRTSRNTTLLSRVRAIAAVLMLLGCTDVRAAIGVVVAGTSLNATILACSDLINRQMTTTLLQRAISSSAILDRRDN